MVLIGTHWFLKIKKILSLLHCLDTMLNYLNKRRQFNYSYFLFICLFLKTGISLYLHIVTISGIHSNKSETSLLCYAAAPCHHFNLPLKILLLTFKNAISMWRWDRAGNNSRELNIGVYPLRRSPWILRQGIYWGAWHQTMNERNGEREQPSTRSAWQLM